VTTTNNYDIVIHEKPLQIYRRVGLPTISQTIPFGR